ncbi:MAG: hypothetical protein BJ554DRAFT_6132 [Olpidium bornovanus]|uniref:Uncharacterized protein n=1 Tax=Olpidium bornovanus TaxID=278681 RepID=A0A8H7ZYP8_9FUNG|nr:MAG: hypothetical protein BJ554DRAFT_6132 [Olpidium bornovanus]
MSQPAELVARFARAGTAAARRLLRLRLPAATPKPKAQAEIGLPGTRASGARGFAGGAAASSQSEQAGRGRARGWRKYAAEFRGAPGSHVVAFAVLHELTAVLPLPVVYLSLQALDPPLPPRLLALVSGDAAAEAERRGRKALAAFGFDVSSPAPDSGGEPARAGASKCVLHAAAAYALVKAAMPLRLAACFALTPWFARACVCPMTTAAAAARALLSRTRSP